MRGDPSLELVEPASPHSPVQRFLERSGGLHHVCYEVDKLGELVLGAAAGGLTMVRRTAASCGIRWPSARLVPHARAIVRIPRTELLVTWFALML